MSDEINIQFTRFSAFYSPLIATIAGGFLKEEGLTPKHSIAPAGKSAIDGVVAGTVQVCQSAPSQGFGPLEKGQMPAAVHFAQINEKDGFFLTARAADPAFDWAKLSGKRVLVDHGGQPLAMFKYACHRRGLEYSKIAALDVPSGQMDGAFRSGQGDYIHQQGPAPQQLEHDRVGHVVASVGEAIGPVAFSSLAATRAWLGTDMAKRFMRAYRKARTWLLETPAAKVAEAEAGVLPGHRPGRPHVDHRVLPEARLLDAPRGDHAPGLRGGPRRLPARGPHHQAPPVRGRGGGAAGGLSHERSAGGDSRRRSHEQSGRAVVRTDAGLARGGCHQGRGARPRGYRAAHAPGSPGLRQPLLPLVQCQQAQPASELEAPARQGGVSQAPRARRCPPRELRAGRPRSPGLRLCRGAGVQPSPRLREHQGLRVVRSLQRLQELRAHRPGDGRRHERHRLGRWAAHVHVAVHRRLGHRDALRDRHSRRAHAASPDRARPAGRGLDAGRGGQPDPGEPARSPAPRQAHGAHGEPARRRRAGDDVSLRARRTQRLRLHLRPAADVASAAPRHRARGPDRRCALRDGRRPLEEQGRGRRPGGGVDHGARQARRHEDPRRRRACRVGPVSTPARC